MQNVGCKNVLERFKRYQTHETRKLVAFGGTKKKGVKIPSMKVEFIFANNVIMGVLHCIFKICGLTIKIK